MMLCPLVPHIHPSYKFSVAIMEGDGHKCGHNQDVLHVLIFTFMAGNFA